MVKQLPVIILAGLLGACSSNRSRRRKSPARRKAAAISLNGRLKRHR